MKRSRGGRGGRGHGGRGDSRARRGGSHSHRSRAKADDDGSSASEQPTRSYAVDDLIEEGELSDCSESLIGSNPPACVAPCDQTPTLLVPVSSIPVLESPSTIFSTMTLNSQTLPSCEPASSLNPALVAYSDSDDDGPIEAPIAAQSEASLSTIPDDVKQESTEPSQAGKAQRASRQRNSSQHPKRAQKQRTAPAPPSAESLAYFPLLTQVIQRDRRIKHHQQDSGLYRPEADKHLVRSLMRDEALVDCQRLLQAFRFLLSTRENNQ